MDENKSFDNPMASSHPLVSTIVTLYTLIFLYFPTTPLLSPLLLSTCLVLLSLLRLGASQRKQPEPENPLLTNPVTKPDLDSDDTPPLQVPNDCQTESDLVLDPDYEPDPEPYFVEWNVRAPLEVIYEGEGEGEEEDKRMIERYASLSMYYPETDTDSYSSEEKNVCFRWEEEDKEGLIEIELDTYAKRNSDFEEDNLIEIDLNFPAT